MKEKTGNLAVKERPMLFNGAMVRALLDGSKTQTRRIMNPQPDYPIIIATDPHTNRYQIGEREPVTEAALLRECPHGQPGDRIWVRETFRLTDTFDLDSPSRVGERCIDAGYKKPWAPILYEADGWRRDWHHVGTPPHDGTLPKQGKTRPSIHMPRWASRILLEIVSVRVERLNDCSDADAVAEGIGLNPSAIGMKLTNPLGESMAIAMYCALWDSINGAGSWAANPWVWVVEFKRVTP